jgi:hypothetical protein
VNKKIGRPEVPHKPGRIPVVELPAEERLRFSFGHLDFSNEKFSLGRCEEGYLSKLLERLKVLSQMTSGQFVGSHARAYRSHPIDFGQSSERRGFPISTEQFQGAPPWQFQLETSVHGRVHGILVRNTFYVVWLDPAHLLFPVTR